MVVQTHVGRLEVTSNHLENGYDSMPLKSFMIYSESKRQEWEQIA